MRRSREAAEADYRGCHLWEGSSAARFRDVADAFGFDLRAQRIASRWRASLGRLRRDYAVDRLVRALSGAPVVSAQSAARLACRSIVSVHGPAAVRHAAAA